MRHNSVRARGLIIRSAVSLLVTLCFTGAALAQSTNSGEIRGTVTDATGALVPGVKVKVLNADTGVSNEYATNDAGLYDTVSILPGNYSVTFIKDGFEELTVGDVVLEVGAPQTVNARRRRPDGLLPHHAISQQSDTAGRHGSGRARGAEVFPRPEWPERVG
jgi:hypothetical protein